ncbi:hypothetical protein DL764_008230 [Monosporascus ibericus]|uniref:WW domain-containing protein n=1 Tax=Monosporascus ibericus TaxID=155417 RepID=A0A4Q4T069_9PEZI|nr:hypothetical protein DL764_008230 [Monosporascus ibericus]
MGRYQYNPLNPSTNDIRLVTILPGEVDDPIKVEITHAELVPPAHDNNPKRLSLKEIRETLPEDWSAHETLEGRVIFWDSVDSYSTWTHPDPTYSREAYDPVSREDGQPKLRYEALSYTWGSSQSPDTVEVKRSDKHWQELCVNRNLAEAMRYLRYEDRPRVMWIDAICINQADVKERSVQVTRMGQIFSLANKVVAWLGPGFSNSKLAVATLDYLVSRVEERMRRFGYPTLDALRETILAPEASKIHGKVRQGDEVFVVLGCDVPMVLRSTPGGVYEVIGDSYVHGISDEEF